MPYHTVQPCLEEIMLPWETSSAAWFVTIREDDDEDDFDDFEEDDELDDEEDEDDEDDYDDMYDDDGDEERTTRRGGDWD